MKIKKIYSYNFAVKQGRKQLKLNYSFIRSFRAKLWVVRSDDKILQNYIIKKKLKRFTTLRVFNLIVP